MGREWLKKVTFLLALMSLFTLPMIAHAEGFEFEMEDPDIRIVVPDLPEMSMETHPMHEKYSHLRYQGTAQPFILSVMTPTADADMTPEECMNSSASSYVERYELGKDEYAIYKLNESTFLLEYLTSTSGVDQIHAHLLSAAAGTHCVDVHISRLGSNDINIRDMHSRFGGAVISEKAQDIMPKQEL